MTIHNNEVPVSFDGSTVLYRLSSAHLRTMNQKYLRVCDENLSVVNENSIICAS